MHRQRLLELRILNFCLSGTYRYVVSNGCNYCYVDIIYFVHTYGNLLADVSSYVKLYNIPVPFSESADASRYHPLHNKLSWL